MKPILCLASGLTASHPIYLVGAHPDHLLDVMLAEQSFAKFF
jgi:hypothetical protein